MNPSSQPSPVPDPAPNPSSASAERVLSVDGALTVASAEAWRIRIADALAPAAALAVDLAGAGEVDVFGLQLLCAARRSAGAQGKTFRVLHAGPAVQRACAAAGFAPASLGLEAAFPTP